MHVVMNSTCSPWAASGRCQEGSRTFRCCHVALMSCKGSSLSIHIAIKSRFERFKCAFLKSLNAPLREPQAINPGRRGRLNPHFSSSLRNPSRQRICDSFESAPLEPPSMKSLALTSECPRFGLLSKVGPNDILPTKQQVRPFADGALSSCLRVFRRPR